ncbi:DEAD/DEAH box helicase [Desulfocurvibacter africanus]|uniref:DEAD/DEAH box helicase domain protein n=1 Tax=Desulfocurvibacter africanus subsp. africanus str. Walvis Bay TaxID=690850 RepID=F3YYU0_DESAF|nr:DEAD/DEAH box helicase [Desulfocurvibacter africanus]EGJ51916.1 DEAD/DEAH box helicase domain protein [Desulfocurvibacter africanus subsp. africanus str. Walvis Bay]
MSFDSFSLDQRIMAGILAAGYTTPTPIQTRAIPAVLAGKDVMGLAQTGTGKTAAFVLPLLQRLLNDNAPTRGPIRVLVLAPTRELAVQIHQSFFGLGKQTGIRSAVVIGGVGAMPQIKALRQATVAVACPGRLVDLMNQGAVDLSKVSALVLDEADRMLDMGFLPDVRKVMAKLPRQRQNMLFSATMPAEIRSLAESGLRDPVTVQVSNTAPAATVSHALYPVAGSRKQDLLEKLLNDLGKNSALVFTRTKHRAKGLAQKLAGKGFSVTSLQGNLSQGRRQEAMDGFRNGKYRVMVATDIAARGIDCERVSLVVNFDLPDTAEAYTHRIGRTGRAERNGEAVSLVAPEDESQVKFIERSLNLRIERKRLDGFSDSAARAPQYDSQPRTQQSRRPGPAPRKAIDSAATKSLLPVRSGAGATSRGDNPTSARPKAAASAGKPRQHSASANGGASARDAQPRSRAAGQSQQAEGPDGDRWMQVWGKAQPKQLLGATGHRGQDDRRASAGRTPRNEGRSAK